MMKEKRSKEVSRDFIHLSQEISRDSYSSIPDELAAILETCVCDPFYKDLADKNIVSYLLSNEKVKSGLKSIIDDPGEDFAHIKDIAKEFLDRASISSKCKK